MIPYEELVAALDRYVARNGGTPQSVRAPASAHAPEHHDDLPSGGFDEPHDPDMHGGIRSSGGDEDSTHVGAMPDTALPPPPVAAGEDPSQEIDIGDVLADEEV